MTNQKRRYDYWPTRGWRTSTPEEQGMDTGGLIEALDFLTKKDHGPAPEQLFFTTRDISKVNVHSLTVIRHGYLVTDVYFYPYTPNTKHDLGSATKSITATVVGIALNKGHIKSVEQPVLDFFSHRTVANIDVKKRYVTLEHVLTMTSGLDCHSDQGEMTLRQMWQAPDWVQFTLDLHMIEEPGSRFEYCSPGSHLLSAIVQESTGMSTEAFARENLFKQLGISDFVWPANNLGVNNGWGRVRMRPHDLAKIGYLYLNNGYWDGERILSPAWVKAATEKHSTPPPEMGPWDGYGYQWWISSLGFYSARGRGNQYISIIPDKDMVVVFTGGHPRSDVIFEALSSFIIPAARSETSLPPNPQGVAALESRIAEIARGRDQKRTPPPLPVMAGKISGKTFELNAKPVGNISYPPMWKSFSLSFNRPDEAVLNFEPREPLSLYWNGPRHEFPVGLDGIFRITPQGAFDIPVAVKGSWESANNFVVYFDEIGNTNNWRISMAFTDDGKVAVLMQESTFCGDATFDGRLRQ
ncbi:MAG: serine hydrolase [Dehalococcoidales bacterium]|nr:serine hydrolase [Dehalococcoidales bacterium]